MKIIIDIPEDYYKIIKYDVKVNHNDFKPYEIIANGTSFSEELEKIKNEIQGLIDFEKSCCGNATLGYQCLGVIEDRISELKGETPNEDNN